MSRSNGLRPVNKADSSKGTGKKAMTKSRREDSKKLTKPKSSEIIEKVFNERNLSMGDRLPEGVNANDVIKAHLAGEHLPQSAVPTTDIQRKVIAEANAAMNEVLNLSTYTVSDEIYEFVKKQNIPTEKLEEMIQAAPWTVFVVNETGYMKTPDNKIDTVRNYSYRLERAVLDVIKVKNSEIELWKNRLDLADKKINAQNESAKIKEATIKKLRNEKSALQESLDTTPIAYLQKGLLFLVDGFCKLKASLIKLVSEDNREQK